MSFGKVEANRVFLVPWKWLKIWLTDALNFLKHRSHLSDCGWLGFTVVLTENLKKQSLNEWSCMSQKMLAHVKARPINHILYLLLFLKVSWNSWQTNFWEKITRIKQQKVILLKLTERLLLLVHRRIPTQTFRGPANCTLDQPYVSTKLDPQG